MKKPTHSTGTPVTVSRPLPKPKPKHKPKPGHVAPPHSTGSPVSIGRTLPPHHHKPPHKPAKPKPKKRPRRLSPGDIALCPAEAVAAAARLAGWDVSAEDVLDLYARCADGPSSGFTIAAALTAGLPGIPFEFGEVMSLDSRSSEPNAVYGLLPAVVTAQAGLILGVDLPGPHAVTVAPDGCWVSWGEHYDPAEWPDAVIEEAWAVSFDRH